ncbi:hypothetical protein Q6264_31030, partial [Klebsiella pneumoniae]|uniref:hypothetical protein n=1 Tax=Klebsiella pneumoniae TaxID=573 RepID=UPI00272F0B1B
FSRQGEYVDHDRYVFVVDTQGVLLASGGPSSALIGRDVSEVLGPDLRLSFMDALTLPQGQTPLLARRDARKAHCAGYQ